MMTMRTSLLAGVALALLLQLTPHPALAQDQGAAADTAAAREKRGRSRFRSRDRAACTSRPTKAPGCRSTSARTGRPLVFDLLGDLSTLPLSGGTATRITSGLALDGQPRFSPDGEKVLFVSDRSGGENLWTLDLASGDTAEITKGNSDSWMSPDWTPDGRYVVALKSETRLGVHRLWMGHAVAGREVARVRHPPREPDGAAHPRPGHGERAVARVPRHARRAGVHRRPGRLSGDGLHARLTRGGSVVRRQDLAHPGGRLRRDRRADARRGGRGRPSRAALRLSDRGHAAVHGPPDRGGDAVAGRLEARVHRARRAVRDGLPGRHAPAHRPAGRDGAGRACVVARRPVARVGDVERGGRSDLQGARGRPRRRPAAHAPRRAVPAARVEQRGRPHRGASQPGPRLRGVGRARLRGRRDGHRPGARGGR